MEPSLLHHTFLIGPARFTALHITRRLGRSESVEPSAEAFPLTNGVKKQGCVLTPTLLSMMLSARLSDAFRDCHTWLWYQVRDRWKVVQPKGTAGSQEGEGDCSQRQHFLILQQLWSYRQQQKNRSDVSTRI